MTLAHYLKPPFSATLSSNDHVFISSYFLPIFVQALVFFFFSVNCFSIQSTDMIEYMYAISVGLIYLQ